MILISLKNKNPSIGGIFKPEDFLALLMGLSTKLSTTLSTNCRPLVGIVDEIIDNSVEPFFDCHEATSVVGQRYSHVQDGSLADRTLNTQTAAQLLGPLGHVVQTPAFDYLLT